MPDFAELLNQDWVIPLVALIIGVPGALLAFRKLRHRKDPPAAGDDKSLQVHKATTGNQSPESIGSGDQQVSYGSGNVSIQAHIVTVEQPVPARDAEALAKNPAPLGVPRESSAYFVGRDGEKAALSMQRAIHTLPAPPVDFVGREHELDELVSIATNGVQIVGLFGMGGVGKTSIALKGAEALQLSYPDGQFYLDLKGVDARPLAPTRVMQAVLRAFMREFDMPHDDDGLLGLFRSCLADRRVLILLDNAADAAQLTLLVPPTGSLLITTSRNHFTLPGLHRIPVDVFSQEDACTLVTAICSRAESIAVVLSELCCNLPLALRVSASTLVVRPDLELGEYVDKLRRTKEYLDTVDPTYGLSFTASIQLSYELLSDEFRRFWRQLAVLEFAFDHTDAAAAWGVDDDSANDILGHLLCNSLIEWAEASADYHLHDLVRQVANERLAPE